MKIVMFQNVSGDDAYPIMELDEDLTRGEIRGIVIGRIGDDYCVEEDELYGSWWIEDFTGVPLASKLITMK